LSRVRFDHWILIVIALAGGMISGGLGYLSQRQDLEGIEALSNDNTLWHATALEREAFRFGRSIETAMLGLPELQPVAEDPVLRFDILWSRVVTAQSGILGRSLAEIDEDRAIERLAALLRRFEPQVIAFDPSATTANAEMLRELADAQRGLGRLATLSDRAEQSWTAQIHQRMKGSAELSKATGLIALFLCGLIALAIRRQARLDASRLSEIRSQAERAAAAARTRERFLTMVSHELRTPMNGVLGMVSLLGTTRLDDRQAMFAREAGRSGHLMLHVVEALLDMSEIHDEVLTLRPTEFGLTELVDSIVTQLRPVITPGPDPLPVSAGADAEARFFGDMSRIAQVAVRFLLHIHATIGARSWRCILAKQADGLAVAICFGAGERLRWRLESVLDPEEAGDDSHIATDAAGPAAARELLKLMGARAELQQSPDGAIELTLAIPPSVRPARGPAEAMAPCTQPRTVKLAHPARAQPQVFGNAASRDAHALRTESDADSGQPLRAVN